VTADFDTIRAVLMQTSSWNTHDALAALSCVEVAVADLESRLAVLVKYADLYEAEYAAGEAAEARVAYLAAIFASFPHEAKVAFAATPDQKEGAA